LWDVFISHATEDKDEIARPLANALRNRGLSVWFDEDAINLGDTLRRTIDEGLSKSKNGVFILSPNFFKKEWPQKELDVFYAREINGEKVIIPIWHNLSSEDILRLAPTISTHLAIQTAGKTIDEIAVQIIEVVRQRQENPNIGKISEKIVRIEASVDSIIVGTSISFKGTCLNCEGNVHLILTGPGRFSSGKEIATVAPSDKNTWAFTLPPDYTEQPGDYSMVICDSQKSVRDAVSFNVKKGAVTIVAAGDQYYYIGEKIQLYGTSLAGKDVYLSLKGLNPQTQDRKLDQLDVVSKSGDSQSFVKVSVGYDNTWSYIWDTSKIGLRLDKGQYTIYAVESPVTSDDISEESNGTVSIIIEMPFVSATMSQSIVSKGKSSFIVGTAVGLPDKIIQIWIFGESFADVQRVQVNPDASFKLELSKTLTTQLLPGQYFVIVQHPMMNNIFDVYLDDNGQDVFTRTSGGKTYLFSIRGPRKIKGIKAAMALVTAINNPLIDDTYAKLQFLIDGSERYSSDEENKKSISERSQRPSTRKRKNVPLDESAMNIDLTETNIHGDLIIAGPNTKVVKKGTVDNSINYETDKQDFWLFELIAPPLIEKLGIPKILVIGSVSIVAGLLSIIAPAYKISFPFLFWVGAVLLIVGVFFIAVFRYHSQTRCKKCNQEFAYEEIDTPTVKEVTTSDGYIKKTTTRKYKCKYCGDIDTRKTNETIPPKSDSE
jgi:hypothetical protein